MMMMNMMMGGPYGKGKGKGGGGGGGGGSQSMIGKTKKELLVWIGGLGGGEKDTAFNKELQQFFNDQVGGCKYVEMSRKNSGAAIFDTEENATKAIAQLNGSAFKDHVLELDVWTRNW